MAGVLPRDRSVNPAHQCEQGQNLMMIASQVVLLFLAAGATWGVDGLLGLF